MDKYEYKVRTEEIWQLIRERDYAQAAELADTIDWRRVRSVITLGKISDLYKINRRYEDARDILLLAYERHPGDRRICYSLCELSITMGDLVAAIEFYKEFSLAAPNDSGRYILRYKMFKVQGTSLEEQIEVLEELKKVDYREKWAYELAYLYHRVGLATRCVEECDELILWFGDGPYVTKAMELKMLHEPLTPEQQAKYDHRFDAPKAPEEAVEAAESDESEDAAEDTANAEAGYADEESASADALGDTQVYEPLGGGEQEPADAEEFDIHVKTVDVGQYNTMNLQQELAAGLREVLEDDERSEAEKEITRSILAPMMVSDDTGTLEEPSAEELAEEAAAQEAMPRLERSEVFFGETGEMVDMQELTVPEEARETILEAESVQEETVAEPTPTEAEAVAVAETALTEADAKSLKSAWENGEVGEEVLIADDAPAEAETEPESVAAGVAEADLTEADAKSLKSAWENGEVGEEVLIADDTPTEAIAETEAAAAEEAEELTETEPVAEAETEEEFYIEATDMPVEAAEEQPEETVVDTTAEAAMAQMHATYAESAREALHAQPPREMAGVLAQDSDGQLSFVMPEAERIEKQITGQLSIDDVLAEWERMKQMTERQQEEDVRRHVLQETGEMFTEFEKQVRDGLLEQLERSADEEEASAHLQISDATQELGILEEADLQQFMEAVEPTEHAASLSEVLPQDLGTEDELDGVEELVEIADEDAITDAEEEAKPETLTEGTEEEFFEESEEEFYVEPDGQEEMATLPEIEAEGLQTSETESAEPDESLQDDDTDIVEELEEAVEPSEPAVEEETAAESQRAAEKAADTATGTASGERERTGVRKLTREECELYAPFIQSKSAREQLAKAIDSISLAAYTGNIIVTGDEGMDTIGLAKNMVRELQATDSNFSGKVAKISGAALNKKDVAQTLKPLRNGALIITKASELDDDTTNALYKVLQKESEGMVILLEDTRKAMNRFLAAHESFAGSFTSRMDVEALSNDSLGAFGRQYARECEYSIDELGMLALFTRIEELQTYDHAVTVMDVKEIVDEAIHHVNRKTPGHFFDILFGKRYDSEDMIILGEKDFV